jgi:hypothetical protein
VATASTYSGVNVAASCTGWEVIGCALGQDTAGTGVQLYDINIWASGDSFAVIGNTPGASINNSAGVSASKIVWGSTGLALTVPGGSTAMVTSTSTFTSGAGAQIATLTNSPVSGNPTSWIKIVDNGVARYIPAW